MEAEAGNNDIPNPTVEDQKFGAKSKPTTARNKENGQEKAVVGLQEVVGRLKIRG